MKEGKEMEGIVVVLLGIGMMRINIIMRVWVHSRRISKYRGFRRGIGRDKKYTGRVL